MKLLTKQIIKQLPPIRATEEDDSAKAIVKFFNPCGAGTWWAFEYDPENRIFFGVAEIHEREIGSFSLDDLEGFEGPFGLGIERDLHYTPQTINEIMGWESENV